MEVVQLTLWYSRLCLILLNSFPKITRCMRYILTEKSSSIRNIKQKLHFHALLFCVTSNFSFIILLIWFLSLVSLICVGKCLWIFSSQGTNSSFLVFPDKKVDNLAFSSIILTWYTFLSINLLVLSL